MTLKQATVTESILSAALIVAIALPIMTIAGLDPMYAGLIGTAVVGLGNIVYWKARGESVRDVYTEESDR